MINEIFIRTKVRYFTTTYPYYKNLNQILELDIKSTGDVINRQTYVKSYMTNWNEIRFKSFKILSEFVINTYNLHMVKNEVFYSVNDIRDMWGLIYKKGDYAEEHDHFCENLYSFVYYVKASKKSSPLIFTEYFPFGKKIKPKTGMLIIFPSYMRHKVPIQKYDDERIVIAGNF